MSCFREFLTVGQMLFIYGPNSPQYKIAMGNYLKGVGGQVIYLVIYLYLKKKYSFLY